MKNIKIIVATHKKYQMPKEKMYIPVQVGAEGKDDLGYEKDNTGDNISLKNPYYCELTGLYWAWKNLNVDYVGLVHYRRYLSIKKKSNVDSVLKEKELNELLEKVDVILPKKRKYYIETLYSHYSNTHYEDHLLETRKILESCYNDYLPYFDRLKVRRSGHMFNMFIMKKNLLDDYCTWLFDILEKLESKIDFTKYDAFQARLFGRISELLLDVYIEKNKINYKEVECVYLGKIDYIRKVKSFLNAKIRRKKYDRSF